MVTLTLLVKASLCVWLDGAYVLWCWSRMRGPGAECSMATLTRRNRPRGPTCLDVLKRPTPPSSSMNNNKMSNMILTHSNCKVYSGVIWLISTMHLIECMNNDCREINTQCFRRRRRRMHVRPHISYPSIYDSVAAFTCAIPHWLSTGTSALTLCLKHN